MKNTPKNNEELISVYIPKLYKHDDAQYVAVNGKRILVRKGETVALPKKFASVILNSLEAAKQAEDYISKNGQEG